MSAKEKILALCEDKGITIHKLEMECGFGNGSIKRAASIKADRLQKIAEYFNVPLSFFTSEDNYEWSEYRETLATSPETRMLLDIVKGADAETLIQLTKIAEALRNG